MAVYSELIQTQTLASAAGSIVFSSIPQTYADLRLVFSVRAQRTSNTWDNVVMYFNGITGTQYSSRIIYSQASGAVAVNSNAGVAFLNFIQYAPTATATANLFSNGEVYIPNYAGNKFKQVIANSVAPTLSVSDNIFTYSAGLWSNTAAINSITIAPGSLNLEANSSISLYGIKNS
jgi:hypothetical protein